MKDEKDYIQDIAEIRSMMERSSKFLSLSGWAGIMAGIYALSGVYIAYAVLKFNPTDIATGGEGVSSILLRVVLLGCAILVLAIGTAVFLSWRKANASTEKIWNASAKRLLINMTVPLVAGGLFILILISHGLIYLIAPMSLLFYGIALYSSSKFTYEEMRILGLIEMGLGLISAYFVDYGLLIWAFGFGLVHIVYGIYLHYKYER